MNNGCYLGRLVKEMKMNESGKMAIGTVAVDRPFPFGKDKEGNQITDFLTIKIIGEDKVKRAAQYLAKGTKIAFTGITCRDTSKDADGNYSEFNYIMVTNWEFAESKNSAQHSEERPASDGFMSIQATEEELPFQ